jgi:hypothetical protein
LKIILYFSSKRCKEINPDYTETAIKDSIRGPNLHFCSFISVAQHFFHAFTSNSALRSQLVFSFLFLNILLGMCLPIVFLAVFFPLICYFLLVCFFLIVVVFLVDLFVDMMLFFHFFRLGFSLDT